MKNTKRRAIAMILAFLPALGTVPIYAEGASPMEVTFVSPALFIMRPHTNNTHGFVFGFYRIPNPMLAIYPS